MINELNLPAMTPPWGIRKTWVKKVDWNEIVDKVDSNYAVHFKCT